MELSHVQEKIIVSLKNDLIEYEKNKINTASSSLSFVATWGENIGFQRLKSNYLNTLSNFEFLKSILKDLFSAIKFCDINYLDNSIIKNQNRIILSTASLKDFSNEGSYVDRYLKIDSKNYNNHIFLLLYGNEALQKNIDPNIILFKKENNFIKGIFYFFSSFLK